MANISKEKGSPDLYSEYKMVDIPNGFCESNLFINWGAIAKTEFRGCAH
jgi:hypothetical protein